MIELDWAEFGMVTVADGPCRRSVGEIGLLSWSHTLPSMGLNLSRFHPADPQLGLGLTSPVDWDLWPAHFRGGLLFRKLVVNGRSVFFIHCVRGEIEQPVGPSSRYFSFGRWFVLPEHWFTVYDPNDSKALDDLQTRLYTALHELCALPELVVMQQATEKKRLELRPLVAQPPVATIMQNARHLAAGGRGVQVGGLLAAAEPDALVRLIMTALLVHDGFDAISEAGIAVNPPPSEHDTFAVVIPRTPIASAADREPQSQHSSLGSQTTFPIPIFDTQAKGEDQLSPRPVYPKQKEFPPNLLTDSSALADKFHQYSMSEEPVDIPKLADIPNVAGVHLAAGSVPETDPIPLGTASTSETTESVPSRFPEVQDLLSSLLMQAEQPAPEATLRSVPDVPAPSSPSELAVTSQVLRSTSHLVPEVPDPPPLIPMAAAPQSPPALIPVPAFGSTAKPAKIEDSLFLTASATSGAEHSPQPIIPGTRVAAANRLPILLISIAISIVLVSFLCWIVMIVTQERERQVNCEMLFPLHSLVSIYSTDANDATSLLVYPLSSRRVAPVESLIPAQESNSAISNPPVYHKAAECDCPNIDRDKEITNFFKSITADSDSIKKMQQLMIRCRDIWQRMDGATNSLRRSVDKK